MQDLQSENRECPFSLVEKLKGDLSDAEIKSVLSCISENDDFRIEQPLLAVLEDLNLTEAVRERASLALCGINTHDTPAQRATWWASGDNVMMRHSLRVSEAEEALLVETVASDWSSPFQCDALEVLHLQNRALHSQQIRIAALSHPDSKVRIAAAKSLLWDQPVCAEAALLQALHDESDEVVFEVGDALCWYQSQAVLVELHKRRCESKPELSCYFNNVFNWVFKSVEPGFVLEPDETDRLANAAYRKWLSKLDDTLCWITLPDNDTCDEMRISFKEARDMQKYPQVSVSEVIELYGDFNKRRPFFGRGPYDWKIFSENERHTLTAFFLESPDYLVRQISVQAFVAWNDPVSFLKLLKDPAHRVRRSACYNAENLRPDARIREALKEILDEPNTAESFATETLASFVVHSREDENLLIETLEDLIRNDKRERVRDCSLQHLLDLKPDRLKDFFYILDEPPMERWALHETILRNCRDPNLIVPHLNTLNEIDDFEVQQALACLRAMC